MSEKKRFEIFFGFADRAVALPIRSGAGQRRHGSGRRGTAWKQRTSRRGGSGQETARRCVMKAAGGGAPWPWGLGLLGRRDEGERGGEMERRERKGELGRRDYLLLVRQRLRSPDPGQFLMDFQCAAALPIFTVVQRLPAEQEYCMLQS